MKQPMCPRCGYPFEMRGCKNCGYFISDKRYKEIYKKVLKENKDKRKRRIN